MWLSTPKFKDLANDVLETKRTRAPGTFAMAKHYLGKLTAHFGETRVAGINEAAWGKYVTACKLARPARKLHDDKKYMSQVLLMAHRQGHLKRPVKLRIPDGKSDVGREITADELGRLFALASPRMRLQMELALKTGMRLREMLHLRWDRLEWGPQAIRLRRQDTKTRRGRIIPLTPELFEQLKARHEKSRSPYVFPHRFDANRPQNENKTAWLALKADANVQCRWHDFRHTCATLLLRRGVSVSVTHHYLGMSARVLAEIYEHLNLDDLKSATRAMTGIGHATGPST